MYKRVFAWKFIHRLILLTGLLVVCAAPRFHVTRPRPRCYLPPANYQLHRYSASARSLSNAGLPLRAGPTSGERVWKSFQFVQQPALRVDHCEVSRLSVLIDDQGNWSLSLRAGQNTGQAANTVTSAEPSRQFSDHLLRNQFHIRVHCYARSGDLPANSPLGRPLVATVQPQPFWVQKQRPYDFSSAGRDPRLEQSFDLIDRVEVEFFYRTN